MNTIFGCLTGYPIQRIWLTKRWVRYTSHYHWRSSTNPTTEWLTLSFLCTVSVQSLRCFTSYLLGTASLLQANRFIFGTSTFCPFGFTPRLLVLELDSQANFRFSSRVALVASSGSLSTSSGMYLQTRKSSFRNYPFPSLQEITLITSPTTAALLSQENQSLIYRLMCLPNAHKASSYNTFVE